MATNTCPHKILLSEIVDMKLYAGIESSNLRLELNVYDLVKY